jgi:glycerol transport system permease protein
MSLYTSSQAIGGADLGYGSALSMVYLYIVVILCYLLYMVMMNVGQGGAQK